MIRCLQNTPKLSTIVAHLGLQSKRVRQDWPASVLFVPKPSRGARGQRCCIPDLGTTVRQRPLVSTVGDGDCYSLGYSVGRESVS